MVSAKGQENGRFLAYPKTRYLRHSIHRNHRRKSPASSGWHVHASVLLVTAGAGIVGGIGFMVFGHIDGNTAVGRCIISVVTLLAGKFATAFDFEFGGSADSEQTRTLLAHAPPIGK